MGNALINRMRNLDDVIRLSDGELIDETPGGITADGEEVWPDVVAEPEL